MKCKLLFKDVNFLLSFIFSTISVLCAGTLSSFSAYSNDLKDILQSTTSIDYIGSYGDFGVFTGILMGLFVDKYGSKKAQCLSHTLVAGSYLFYYFITISTSSINISLLCFLYFLIGSRFIWYIC